MNERTNETNWKLSVNRKVDSLISKLNTYTVDDNCFVNR